MASATDKYHVLVELAPDPIFLMDPSSGSVIGVNDRAAELLGYDQSTLEGMDVTELHPSDRLDAYRSLFERTIEEGVLRARTLGDGSQLHLVSQDGGRIPVELHAKTIDVEGEPWIYTIARDVTLRYERERELERQRDRFETFARVVSHDLRNPLNVASGRVGLAREECDSEHLADVERALDRMDALIDDLLQIAREGERTPEWIDLAEFSRTCWQNVATTDATIVTDADGTIHADRSRLQQLFENLMRNAVEHGGNEVTITVGDLEGGFYFEDDGPGIPPEERDRVFELGCSSEGGTGLGLGIVKQVIDEHDWNIRVADGRDGGARFEITGIESR